MELSVYDIVKKPVISTKSIELYRKFGKVTLEVHRDVNKLTIKHAVEKIWDVKVADVRVVSVPGKTKSFARKTFKSAGKKKAIVTLKQGYKIVIPGMFESMGVANASEVVSE